MGRARAKRMRKKKIPLRKKEGKNPDGFFFSLWSAKVFFFSLWFCFDLMTLRIMWVRMEKENGSSCIREREGEKRISFLSRHLLNLSELLAIHRSGKCPNRV